MPWEIISMCFLSVWMFCVPWEHRSCNVRTSILQSIWRCWIPTGPWCCRIQRRSHDAMRYDWTAIDGSDFKCCLKVRVKTYWVWVEQVRNYRLMAKRRRQLRSPVGVHQVRFVIRVSYIHVCNSFRIKYTANRKPTRQQQNYLLTLWPPLLTYWYCYKASCARPG